MPIISEIEGAISSILSVPTSYGTATIRLFRGRAAPQSSSTLMFVSHGWQLTPGSIESSQTDLPSYAWFIPIGCSLERLRFDGWAPDLATRFVENRLAFATSGIPNAIVGAHYIEPREKGLERVLSPVVAICDIAVFDDLASAGPGAQSPFLDTASLPLSELVSAPLFPKTYRAFLMHACRAAWPPRMAGGRVSAAQGLFTYNDDFKTLLD